MPPIKYNIKSRKDISNPHHKFLHEELLRMAMIQTYGPDEYLVQKLDNGRIVVRAKVPKTT
jgi:hypothetical protein